MNDFLLDLRFGIRQFFRNPAITIASALVLAIGIGGITTMFSTFKAVVLNPLPFEDPDRLVWAWGENETITENSVSAVNYWDYRERADAFESLGSFLVFSPGVIITGQDEPQKAFSSRVSANLFDMLGVQPQVGRPFLPQEEDAGTENVVMFSDSFWLSHFDGDASVVGTAVSIGSTPYTVVGIMPPGFDYPGDVDLWFPMEREGSYESGRGNNNFRVVGRLRDGLSIETAQSQLDLIGTQLQSAYPDTNQGWHLRLIPLHERYLGDLRSTLGVVLSLVALVLLIACANVASLSLAQLVARNREISLRLSLGASRMRVVRQLLTESLLISMVGGGTAILLTLGALSLLRSQGPSILPRIDTVSIDPTVLAFTLAVSVLTSLLVGVAPALLHAQRVAAVKASGDRTAGGDFDPTLAVADGSRYGMADPAPGALAAHRCLGARCVGSLVAAQRLATDGRMGCAQVGHCCQALSCRLRPSNGNGGFFCVPRFAFPGRAYHGHAVWR